MFCLCGVDRLAGLGQRISEGLAGHFLWSIWSHNGGCALALVKPAVDTLGELGRARTERTKMADEQGRGTAAGRPALNFERIYGTTVPAEEVARALADHFRMQEFEVQVYRSSENRTVMQARKESLWRQLLGSPTR